VMIDGHQSRSDEALSSSSVHDRKPGGAQLRESE
jgi:hypothetical protein